MVKFVPEKLLLKHSEVYPVANTVVAPVVFKLPDSIAKSFFDTGSDFLVSYKL